MVNRKKQNKKTRIRILALIIVCAWIWVVFRISYNAPFVFEEGTVIQIEKGDTISKFYSNQAGVKRLMTKLWMKNHREEIPNLQEGKYELSGSYSRQGLLDLIAAGPRLEYLRMTIIEGWTKYDIDQMLTDKGYITKGAYIQKVDDPRTIAELKEKYPFLAMIPANTGMEGFLYPDTYFLDKDGDVLIQLIDAQLKGFETKVRTPLSNKFSSSRISEILSSYKIIILASVVEAEEKNLNNKPIISGIFVNRLNRGMRLDADITLCYGLGVTHDQCQSKIVSNLDDKTNPYNTRQNAGLPPTPITSPSADTVNAVLNYKDTGAIYYLHDSQGEIHYANTLEEHNKNKEKYL